MFAAVGLLTGLQLVHRTTRSLRALLLPEIAVISQPASLITARLPFQEGNKVHINSGGEERRALLTRRKTSTGSFNQFEYRLLDQPANVVQLDFLETHPLIRSLDAYRITPTENLPQNNL